MRRALLRLLRAASPWEWLLLAVMLVLTDRYFWLMDDAFVYFRYVDNLLFLGRGLVFNPGEYVEGYSSPAWLLLLIPLRALGFDYWTLVRAVSLVFAAAFGALVIATNRRLSPPSAPRVNAPLAFAAAHYGILSHFSSGLEAPLVELMAAVYGLAAVLPGNRALQLMIGLSPLCRPELALPCAVFGVFELARTRRFPWMLAASTLLFNGGWLLFRIYYYADLLPTTFYLKASSDWRQGFYYLRNALDPHQMSALALIFLVLFIWCRRELPGPRSARPLMLLCAAPVALWVVRIGGDMLYFRYLAFPVCLASIAGGGILEAVLLRVKRPRLRALLAPAATLFLMLYSLGCYPPQLRGHPLSIPRTRHWHLISDPMWHRKHPHLRASPRRAARDRDLRAAYAAATAAQRSGRQVVVDGWCRRAFVEWDKYYVHSLALTDAVLARVEGPWGRPGHKMVEDQAQLLGKIMARYPDRRGRGLFRYAAERRNASRWLRENLATLELIERKIYNRHDLRENLELALIVIRSIPG